MRRFYLWRWCAQWDVCGHWHRTRENAERCARVMLAPAWKALGVRIERRAR
jgi:hypothetical protein